MDRNCIKVTAKYCPPTQLIILSCTNPCILKVVAWVRISSYSPDISVELHNKKYNIQEQVDVLPSKNQVLCVS